MATNLKKTLKKDNSKKLIVNVKNTKNIHNAKKKIKLKCEWLKCNKICGKNEELFCEHIQDHLKNLIPINDNFHCYWNDCQFSTESSEYISRHILFHEHHTVLKYKSKILSIELNLPKCKRESSKCNKIPELPEKFKCRYTDCERQFNSVVLFAEHAREHCIFEFDVGKSPDCNTKQKIKCGWNFCNKEFNLKYRLQEHIRSHINEKHFSCYNCGQFFVTRTSFVDHCNRQYSNKQLQCNQCFKHFSTDRLLRRHINAHINCFKCTMCDMTCPFKHSLARHIRNRHLVAKPFECVQCEVKFVIKSDLIQHIAGVHEKRRFKCPKNGCDYTIKSKYRLKKHITEAHSDNKFIYACHCCDKVYKDGYILSRHLIKIHKFQLPSGHKRFTYCRDENGIYRLKTMRIESLEVTKQIYENNGTPGQQSSSVDFYEISEISESSNIDLMSVEDYPVPIQKVTINIINPIK